MIKATGLFVLVLAAFSVTAQMHPSIGSALNEIRKFNKAESQRDSSLGHWLGSNSEADFARRYQFYKVLYDSLSGLNPGDLEKPDRINLELLLYEVRDEISAYKFKSYLNPILSDEGFHTGLAYMGNEVLVCGNDFSNYINRLIDIPRYIEEHLELMRKGLSLGICQPAVILSGYQNTYEQHIVTDPLESVFWKPFQNRPTGFSDKQWDSIQTLGKSVIMNYAVKGYIDLKIFFKKEYLPHTRKTIGVSHFPDGLAYYQDRVHHYTSTDLHYDSIYEMGLREVARIKIEMQDVMNEVNFKGNLKAFIQQLRSDKRFYVNTPEQLLKEASYIAKKADGQLPRFFGRLPRQPYGVEAVPAHLAPTYTAGRYAGASMASRRAGHYWVNTYNLAGLCTPLKH